MEESARDSYFPPSGVLAVLGAPELKPENPDFDPSPEKKFVAEGSVRTRTPPRGFSYNLTPQILPSAEIGESAESVSTGASVSGHQSPSLHDKFNRVPSLDGKLLHAVFRPTPSRPGGLLLASRKLTVDTTSARVASESPRSFTESSGSQLNSNENGNENVTVKIDPLGSGSTSPNMNKSGPSSDYFKPSHASPTSAKSGRPPAKEPTMDHHFKLISVAFKEAALDSPSFRASMNHLDSQLVSTEKWLQAIAALLAKIPKQAKELLSMFLYLDYLVPSFLQDGIVDPEYTLTALRGTRDGLQKLWSIAQSSLQINMPSIDAWEKTILTRMVRYKHLRQRFHRAQRKYDHFLNIHMGMLKGKDPALLLEDLQQLAAVRNEYLKSSLDLVVEFSEISLFINRQLISFVYKIWQDKLEKLGENPFVLALFSDVWEQVKRIHCWCETHRKSSLKMSLDMLRAKKNIQEHSIAQLAPSRNLDDYKSDLINQRLLQDIDESSSEKHGYLFMKTYTEKSKQPIWVRRWAFLQGGVLGFLVLDPSLTSVQETDKIGVLLCNVRYAPNEERNFCFEVKTIDTRIVLQAETLYELKSWLKVFSNIGRRIVDLNDPMHGLLTVASGRYPPLVLEFQSTANTTTDKDLTHSKIVSSSGQVITSSKLSAHLVKNEAFFQRYIYDQIGRISLPFVTETTRSALVAYSLTGSTVVPSALSANIWGSLNWGLYYLYEPNAALELQDSFKTITGEKDGRMPANFPNLWAARDVQLKALFESAVEPGEFCLLSYHCLLSPNQSQSLRGTHFVTQRHIYSYIQSLGFITLSKIPLCRVMEAVVEPMQDHDILKLTMVLGLLKMKLFIDDSILIEKKFQGLIKAYSSDKPLLLSELINQLIEIEDTHTEMLRQKRYRILQPVEKEPSDQSFDFLPVNVSPPDTKLGFPDTMPLVTEKKYDLPPQALLHVLFGSKSQVFMDSYQVMDVRQCEKVAWLKPSNPDIYLLREFIIDVLFFNGKAGRLVVSQDIEKFVENKFYSVKVRNSTFKMKYGPTFDYSMRFIIQESGDGQSSLKCYGSTNVNASYISRIAPRYLGNTIIPLIFTELSRRIHDAVKHIGVKAKVSRANYIYGRIQVTEAPLVPRICPHVVINNGVICNWCIQIKVRQLTRYLTISFWSIVSAILSFFKKLSMHRMLISIIVCLTLSNVFFGFRSSAHFWKTRQVSKLVTLILQVDPITIHRAVYSKDVEDFARFNMSYSSSSACFHVFQNQSVALNPDKMIEWTSAFDVTWKEKQRARELKERINEIAMKRNQLLLTLATLNQMEEEVVKLEWMDWLYSEVKKCEEMRNAGAFLDGNSRISGSVMEKLEQYCGSCATELSMVKH